MKANPCDKNSSFNNQQKKIKQAQFWRRSGMTGWSIPQWHSTHLYLQQPCRSSLTSCPLLTDHESGKERGQACPNMVTAPGMPSGTASKCFPMGHPVVVSSEYVVDSETSVKITGVQEPILGNCQISPAKGKAVCGLTNWRAGDISFCCFLDLIFILQRQFIEGLSLWCLSGQMWKHPSAWHMFSLSRNSLRWENELQEFAKLVEVRLKREVKKLKFNLSKLGFLFCIERKQSLK